MENRIELGPIGVGPALSGMPAVPAWNLLPPGELPRGSLVSSRYEIKSSLACDDDLQIYRALDRVTGRVVKLKILGEDRDGELSWREAETLMALDHPHVPRSLDTFYEGGRACFVQTYFEGPTLRQHFRKHGNLSTETIVPIMRSVLRTLGYLHAQSPVVVHRDVKPANLILLEDGEVGLIDFDIMRLGTRNKLAVAVNDLTSAFTAGYAPPEQMIGMEAYPSTDLYALAASVLYVTGGLHPIYLWDAGKGRMGVPDWCDPRLAGLLKWMLAPGLDARCPSAQAAIAKLDEIFGS